MRRKPVKGGLALPGLDGARSFMARYLLAPAGAVISVRLGESTTEPRQSYVIAMVGDEAAAMTPEEARILADTAEGVMRASPGKYSGIADIIMALRAVADRVEKTTSPDLA